VSRLNPVRPWMRTAAAPAALLMALAGCKGNAPKPQAPPPPEVGVVTLKPEKVGESFSFTGEVQPFRRVEVRARVDGIVVARPFTEGALVKQGQVLYQLDKVRPEAAYRSALARRDNARRTLQRLEPLLADHAIAPQDVDNARAELDAAQAALDEAKKNLDDTTVRAEITGRVGRTRVEVGARVTGPADLLTTIDVLDPVYVTFQPSAQQLLDWKQNPQTSALIRPGSNLTVKLKLPDGRPLPRTGKLDFVAPSLDSATGTQQSRATFSNPDRLLVPGQFVSVELTGFTRDSALAVPQRAVQQALGRQFVLVVGAGDTVASRDIETGQWSGSRWIIEKGLAAGDRVIVDGAQKAAPGQPVHPVPIAATDTLASAVPAAARGSEAK
jgi:membrane fusion protein (multidrug efflux system)